MRPWETVKSAEIGDWIERRECLWEELDGQDFRKIEIGSRQYRPFDVKEINAVLFESGLFYGAGYGILLKPTFFLAEIVRTEKRGAYAIYVTGNELARDLLTSPSMLQGNRIIVRQEIMKVLLWEKLEEMKAGRYASHLSHAFSAYGLSRKSANDLSSSETDALIEEIVDEERSSYIHHELGEASQRRLLGKWWKELVLSLPYGRAELFVRGLGDLLSDTCPSGMLAHIIGNRKAGSLAFYIAFLGGFRKLTFPELMNAYDLFGQSGDWTLIEEARAAGYRKAREWTETLRNMVQQGRVSPAAIEADLISKVCGPIATK